LARTVGGLEDLDDRINAGNGTATLMPLDITNEQAIKQCCISIYERWGRLDLWAHTAIYAPALSPINHVDEKEFDKTIAINIKATSNLIINLSPLLKLVKGSLAIFFDDAAVEKKYHGLYGMSKRSQIFLAKTWASENANPNTNVLIETPFAMATSTREKFYPGENKKTLSTTKDEAKKIINRVSKVM
jgi:NAD(P)-dependent dehydrogenase (short-subunit alcohol dehydrogenase family)